jgi:hypothetical protein
MDISKKAPFSAYKGKEPFIFISYAHKNSDIVYPFLTELHELGYRIWFDEGIEPGNEWPYAIADAIEKCACVIVFLSPEAVNSRNVSNEINFALTKDKKMLCVYIKETELPKGLALQLGSIQAVMEHKIQHKERFLEQLTGSLPIQTREETRLDGMEKKPETKPRKPRLKALVAVAVPLAAVALLALALGPMHLFGTIPAGVKSSPSEGLTASPGAPAVTVASSVTAISGTDAAGEQPSNPSLNDSFDGTTVDTGKWIVSEAGVMQDGRLSLSNREGTDAFITSAWKFTGDFDFQVDYELGSGWGKNDKGCQTNMVYVEFGDYPVRMCNEYVFGFTSNEQRIDMINYQGVAAVDFLDFTKGTFRISRAGSKITLTYDVGKGWQQLYQGDIPEGHPEASVSFINTCSNGAQGFTAYFDNFKINSGLTTYTGKMLSAATE